MKQGNQNTKRNTKGKSFFAYDEEQVPFKQVKRDKEHKQYRNFENALRSKNVKAIMSYEDTDEDE